MGFVENLLLFLAAKEFWKSVKNWCIYRVAQKNVPNIRMALCNRVVEMNHQKHVCNEQTSSNMSRNSRLQHFRSRDTNEILTRHKTMFASGSSFVVAHTQATPERHSNHQPTDQQKMCWVGPPFCFATAAKRLFHCNIAFLTVWSSTSCHSAAFLAIGSARVTILR